MSSYVAKYSRIILLLYLWALILVLAELLVKVLRLEFHWAFCPKTTIAEAETEVLVNERVKFKVCSEPEPKTEVKVAVPV
jgi:hypothetical protein